jgi:hypothetical protein
MSQLSILIRSAALNGKKKGSFAVATAPETRVKKMTNTFGAISEPVVIKFSLKLPQAMFKKRKYAGYFESMSRGAVTEHHFSFLYVRMDEMDKYKCTKGYCLIMDNASIHKAKEISYCIEP